MGLSCADPTEVVQEAVRSHIEHGSRAYQCFYDLEKAFDSIEYCVLLYHLYNSGINGKGWRVISSFYDNPSGQVRIGNQLTKPFTLHRGIRQGSCLSPMLFILVIDSLLRDLEKADAGISVNNIYTGSFGHADDLRSVTSNLMCVKKQADIMQSFTERNGLKLNTEKLELLPMYQGTNVQPDEELQIGTASIPFSNSSRCLGVVWTHDLSPKQSILLNIKKARKAFFALGSLGVYQGKQSPLTSKEVYEVCIVPICLYGSENWLLTDQLLVPLESFQSELGKRILNLPKYHANQCPLIALRWPSMRLRILKRKIRFLLRLMKPENSSISSKVFCSLRDNDTDPLIVQQCRLLESAYHTNFTQTILTEGDSVDIRSIIKALEKADQDLTWLHAEQKSSLCHLSRAISWMKLWDIARDRGIHGTRCLQVIFKVLTTPIFTDLKCPLCSVYISEQCTYAKHLLQSHSSISVKYLINLLEQESGEIFTVGSKLLELYISNSLF